MKITGTTLTKDELIELVDYRDRLMMEEGDYDKEIDELGEEILKLIKINFDNLPVDIIIESLTHLGWAPNLIYDDNGRFAVTGDGYQPVVIGDELIEGAFTVFVEKEMWQSTIREALNFFIFKD